MSAPFVRFQQYFIRQDVEFFLHLTLHVFTVKTAQYTAQGTFAHGMGNGLAGACNRFN